MIGVYQICHIASDRKYIGSSGNIERRWVEHRSFLRNKKHSSQKLQRAWDKYGELAFSFSIIEESEIPRLREREQFWMDQFRSYTDGFNCTKKALEHSEEVRIRLSQLNLGRKATQETRDKMSLSHKTNGLAPKTDHLFTPESRKKAGLAKVGKTCSEETRMKLRQAQSNRTHGPKGPMSEEAKLKLSIAKTGTEHTPETLAKLKGRVFSEETRLKMSLAAKARANTEKGKEQLRQNGINVSRRRNEHD